MSDEEEAPVMLSKRKIRKNTYWAKLDKALDEYKNMLIINVDFVGSNQLQQVRLALRGKCELLMGKNTMIRKIIREKMEKNPALEGLLPFIKGNMGFAFCKADLNETRKKILEFVVPAAAKSGTLAPVDVKIPAGPTGLDPGQTQFFQTLNISTKISKGAIEITNEVHLIKKGEKVSASAVALLNKLAIKPFMYGIEVPTVYEDGSVYDASVLDLSEDDLIDRFCGAANFLSAISFQIGQVNSCTIPHSFGRAFKMLCAVCIDTGYMFDELKEVKEAIAAGPATGGAGVAAAPAAAAVEEEEEEEAPMADMFGEAEAEEGAADY
jgi:large subunit ribosomal protein LP0